jgi:spore coat polysaccharide biosynthesis predicted glycosyltransferase SpsG
MKLIGIYRGFPGLGRVVAGVELADHFKLNHSANVRLFSYLQGEKYLKQKGYFSPFEVSTQDYSSIGIIPISRYGEYLVNQITEFNPDIVILDGEPLMTQFLKLLFPKIKIVCLLNPFDVANPYNQVSSSLFLNYAYSQADLSLCHGLWKVEPNYQYHNFRSINTIVRDEVLSVKRTNIRNKISCILGGGTINANRNFIDSTASIASKCIQISEYLPSFEIHIYCSCNITTIVNVDNHPNVYIHSKIENCEDYYSNSRLIISRAGRNTMSELLCLGIPSIVIPTGDVFRAKEQLSNAEQAQMLSNGFIKVVSQDTPISKLASLCENISHTDTHNIKWEAGNEDATNMILELYNS